MYIQKPRRNSENLNFFFKKPLATLTRIKKNTTTTQIISENNVSAAQRSQAAQRVGVDSGAAGAGLLLQLQRGPQRRHRPPPAQNVALQQRVHGDHVVQVRPAEQPEGRRGQAVPVLVR